MKPFDKQPGSVSSKLSRVGTVRAKTARWSTASPGPGHSTLAFASTSGTIVTPQLRWLTVFVQRAVKETGLAVRWVYFRRCLGLERRSSSVGVLVRAHRVA